MKLKYMLSESELERVMGGGNLSLVQRLHFKYIPKAKGFACGFILGPFGMVLGKYVADAKISLRQFKCFAGHCQYIGDSMIDGGNTSIALEAAALTAGIGYEIYRRLNNSK